MKPLLLFPKSMMLRILFSVLFITASFLSCNKPDQFPFPGNNTAAHYSSDVIDKWITLQLRLMRDAIGIPNVAFGRYYAYSGIAAFESQALGDQENRFISGKWNGLSGLAQTDRGNRYFWPASVNTALATMNRDIFTTANVTDKAGIDSLETAINTSFSGLEKANVITQSNAFGKFVADAIFSWSETDGYKNENAAYTPPTGPGLWVPTPPAMAPASTPYLGNNRPIVAGSTDNTQPGAPIAYSENPKSEFYQMVSNVYNVSQNLTPDQTAMAIFWRDIPGVTSPGHWLSILQQVIKQTHSRLDKAALAYAITGACLSDASISSWQTKYHYNLVRPITYIQNVLGHSTWTSLLVTPAHPEYSSAHSVISAAAADAFSSLFGNVGSFTDHTYDYLGFTPRTFNSFRAIGEDAGNSRVFAGIHYQPSVDSGLIQGRKVTANILKKLGLPSKSL